MSHRSLTAQVTFAAVVVAAVVATAFVVAILSIGSLRRTNARESQAKDVVTAALQAQTLVVDQETGVRGFVLTGKEQFLDPWRTGSREWPAAIARLQSLVHGDPREEAELQRVVELQHSYARDYAQPIIALARFSPTAARSPIAATEARRRVDGMRTELNRILARENERSRARGASASTTASHAVIAAIVGLAASAVLVLLFGAWVNRAVARPIRRAAAGATAVAHGDLSARLDEHSPGETATLAHAFNAMTRALEASRGELIAQNEQLRESEKAKSDLISMISHELRTPLSSVLGFTALLLQRDFDEAERRRYLEIVDSEARRLAELAEDFLDVRLLEEGRLELAPSETDLAELVRNQSRLFFAHVRDHVVEIEVPDGPMVMRVDADRITQVVANLFSNAIKYSPAGGRITVALRAGDRVARLSVTDDGIGIPAGDQPRIFEKFFRGNAAAGGIGGTGLGLALSRMIIQAHGGKIGFESREAVGSTFWVELPSAQWGRVQTLAQRDERVKDGGSARVA
ncbi:MAG TPA: ATP-binding protein [Gaiellaceae bacterium]|nr:ATP-binding protein [Gaiellaceae bacterium]